METTKRCRKPYPSVQQKAKLINLMEADPELRSGKFSSTFTKQRAVERWTKIRDEINSIPGALKSWEEWRKTWQDMKSKVKKKQADVRRSSQLTGGGSPPQPLDELENQVLATISDCVLIGHVDSAESRVIFDDIQTTEKVSCAAPILNSYVQQQHTSINDSRIDDYAAGPSQPTVTVEVINKPVNEEPKPGKRLPKSKNTAQKRSNASLEVANALISAIKEKSKCKEEYYNKKIEEMRKQSEALGLIARSLAVRANPYI